MRGGGVEYMRDVYMYACVVCMQLASIHVSICMHAASAVA